MTFHYLRLSRFILKKTSEVSTTEDKFIWKYVRKPRSFENTIRFGVYLSFNNNHTIQALCFFFLTIINHLILLKSTIKDIINII